MTSRDEPTVSLATLSADRNRPPWPPAYRHIGVIAGRAVAVIIDLRRPGDRRRRRDDRWQVGVGIGVNRLRVVIPGRTDDPPPAVAAAMRAVDPASAPPVLEIVV